MAISTRSANSTTVRSRFVAPPLVRGAFRVLERTAPAVGARWATHLWCTVPSAGGARADNRPRPGSIRTIAMPGGRSVVTESWGAGPPVYLVHGWGGWRGQLESFVDVLESHGYRAIAFDGPSHGDSTAGALGPRQSTLGELAEALTAVVDHYGPPAAVVGHSLGCAAAAVAIRDGMSVPRLGFVAPVAQPIAFTAEMARGLGFGDRIHSRMIHRLELLVGRPMSDFDLLTMSSAAIPPTLIVADRDDREVGHEQAELLLAAWPQVDLVSTSGLGHRRILRDRGVVDLITSFVAP
jgi:pimeloyl-ACP methyl ester carboxylesterase